MGGSLGTAAGEAVVTGMLRAVEKGTPFIMFAASGGARMQEGILSLMQMPRTTVAVQKLREAGLPYIVVLTHPTTGGVTASYAMLGDIHIAEPGALIGFAGPRVIEQTIREQLPPGFQRAEYLLEHGMVDMVVHRHELRATLSRICRLLMQAPPLEVEAGAEEGELLETRDEPLPGEIAYKNGATVGPEVIEAADPAEAGNAIAVEGPADGASASASERNVQSARSAVPRSKGRSAGKTPRTGGKSARPKGSARQ